MSKHYTITTPRLGLRNWNNEDLEAAYKMNSNERVMEYFPSTWTKEETTAFLIRMREHHDAHGFCYFAADLLETDEFIGFIGLLNQTYEAPFTPCVDIGWRLSPDFWGKGYATEGAKACLDFGFMELKLTEIYSVASVVNTRSIKVMRKIGMKKLLEFDHPKILDYPDIRRCEVYKVAG